MRLINGTASKKILLGLGLVLVLSFIYRMRNERVVDPKTKDPQSATHNPQSSAGPDPSIERATQRLAEFQAERLTEEKPEVSYIGRNLFTNEPVRAFPAVAPPEGSWASDSPHFRVEAVNRREPHSPAIRLASLEPSMAYAQAVRALNFVVRGEGFSSGMKIYINGKPDIVATRFVSDRELQATLPTGAMVEARNLQIEVKKPGDERLFSNPLTLTIAPLPFSFIGEISEQGGRDTRVILINDDERISASIGETLKGRWRIISIVGDYLELEDTQLGNRHHLKRGEPLARSVKESEPEPKSEEKASPNESNESTGETGANLFTRPERPMTYKELLQRRAALRQKHR